MGGGRNGRPELSALPTVRPVVGVPLTVGHERGSRVRLAQLAGQGIQGTFDELGTPLRETTFVVVDLETTG